MKKQAAAANLTLLRLILKPVVRFCLSHSLYFREVTNILRLLFVEVAKEEIEKRHKEVSSSRISAVTGLTRREVGRLLDDSKSASASPVSLISRIIGQWQFDRRFSRKKGKPKILQADSKESEFTELVRSVSKDLNPYTVLFELERLKFVERTPQGLQLLTNVYVPRENAEDNFRMLSADLSDVISAVQENTFAVQEIPNLHLKTEYDNIALESLPEVKRWLLKEGTLFHAKARKFLSRFDADIRPQRKGGGAGARVALGAFSFVERQTESRQEEK